LLEIIISFLFFSLSYLHLKKNENGLLKLLVLVLFLFSLQITYHMIVADTQISNCFIFNQRYPGTNEFDKCIKALTIKDYLFELIAK